MKKRIISLLLVLAMLLSLCVTTAMAAPAGGLTVTDAVAHCHISAFGQTVDSIELTLSNSSVLNSIQADGFTIEYASKFVGMIPCSPKVASVEVKNGKLVLTMGGDEFLLYKSDGSEKQGNPLKITYDKGGIQFSFGYADIKSNNGAIDNLQEKDYKGMQYFVYEPKTSEKLPLVLYIHGNALAGLQKNALAAVDGLMQPEFQAEHPCYVLVPTSMKNKAVPMTGWDEEERTKVLELLQTYIDSGKIDTNRIYVTGNSMGASGTCNLIMDRPDLFAAAMPMCGAEPVSAFQERGQGVLDAKIPIKIVMSLDDNPGIIQKCTEAYEWFQSIGYENVSNRFYTLDEITPFGIDEYPHAADAMAKYDPTLYTWMFAQSKASRGETPAKSGLVARADGFYEYYDANGKQVKFDYVQMPDKSLYFFNSKGIGVEIDYTKISDHVIQIFDNTNDSCFIIIGDEKAAVIDGMNGTVDLKKIAGFFTDKPLVAVLTHGHGDHTGGVQSFDEVHLNEADFDLYKSMIAGSFRFGMIGYDNYLRDTGSTLDYTLLNLSEDIMEENKALKLIPIADSEIFDLGGISIECIAAPGHTPGSMAMLIREDRIIVTGDAANKFTQVQGATVEDYLKTLIKLKNRGADYDEIYSSHGALLSDGTNTSHMAPNMIDELIEGCESILNGTNRGFSPDPTNPDIPVRWALEMDATDHRADGGCGNFMFNSFNIRNTSEQPKPGPSTAEPTPNPAATYTVVRGDTLWGIAKKLFGSGSKWTVIYEANKAIIKNPNMIYAGQVLNIPGN